MDQDPVTEVDARGLACPLPLLKAKQALNASAAGAMLRIVATDPGSVRDFRVFCEMSGHQLVESGEEQGAFVFMIRKRETENKS